ncbi:hypothetical protein KW799_01960 [Candidatus Parcubacteria bacterium]|nr:hypothetical protein [Candidatus Parcubacteria bacterium]
MNGLLDVRLSDRLGRPVSFGEAIAVALIAIASENQKIQQHTEQHTLRGNHVAYDMNPRLNRKNRPKK